MYLQLCGKEPEIENARMLLHFTILQANIIGAPKGTAIAKGSSANLQNHDANTPTSSGTGIGNAVAPDNIAKYLQNPSGHSKVITGTQYLHKQTDRLHVYCLIAT
jgi:hypothetical protein